MAALVGRRLTKDFHVGAQSQDLWAAEAYKLVGGKKVAFPQLMLGAALSGLPPSGTPVLFVLGQWRNAYQGKPAILAKITAAEELAREMQDPSNRKSAALVDVIKAYEARANARAAAKAAPKTRQAAANDQVRLADAAYNKARADADKDQNMVNLQGRLNAILQDMGQKGFTNPLGIQTLPTGKYGSLLVRHGTDALNRTFKGAIWENTSYLTHAHHIVMRNGPKNARAADAVARSKAILRKWGIDIDSRENMVWAPNRGHTVDYAENVLAALETADGLASRDEIIKALARMARRFIAGTNT